MRKKSIRQKVIIEGKSFIIKPDVHPSLTWNLLSKTAFKLEICCFNLASAQVAERAGADRIELCEGLELGGISPNLELVKKVREQIKIPVFIMIRPRGGSFVYNKEEIEKMKEQIGILKEFKVDGFVFGLLKSDRSLDMPHLEELVKWSKPYPITFHRAFDELKDPRSDLELLINLGFSRILTSGQKRSALEGKEMLRELVKIAKNQISIMPGGGIRSNNIKELACYTGALEFHSSALTINNNLASEEEIKKLKLG